MTRMPGERPIWPRYRWTKDYRGRPLRIWRQPMNPTVRKQYGHTEYVGGEREVDAAIAEAKKRERLRELASEELVNANEVDYEKYEWQEDDFPPPSPQLIAAAERYKRAIADGRLREGDGPPKFLWVINAETGRREIVERREIEWDRPNSAGRITEKLYDEDGNFQPYPATGIELVDVSAVEAGEEAAKRGCLILGLLLAIGVYICLNWLLR